MATLLGDVGGTNARLAIARNGSIDRETVTRFRGDDYASFDDVVRQYLQEQDDSLNSILTSPYGVKCCAISMWLDQQEAQS